MCHVRLPLLGAAICSVLLAAAAPGAPVVRLTALEPNRGSVGTGVVLHGSGFTETSNTVHFGPGGKSGLDATNNGTRITYTIPASVSPCDLIGPRCRAPLFMVSPGSYAISVSNAHGRSLILMFRVTP